VGKFLRIAFSLALITLVVTFADWREVWAVLRRVEAGWVVAALLLAVADRVLTNYRWRSLLTGRGVHVGFLRLFRVQLAANFLGSFLPGFIGVDAVRITALCRGGAPSSPVIAATLVDRATLAIATLLLGAVAVLSLAQARIPPHIQRFVLVAAGIVLVLVAICLHPAVRRWVRLTLLSRVPGRLRHKLGEVAEDSLAYRHKPRVLGAVSLLTLAIFAGRILFAKAVAFSCGVDVAMMDLLLIIPILWIVVMLPITIGGIGVQDAGYVVLMALVGVSAPVAVSMSLVEHVVARLASLPGALFLGEVNARAAAPPTSLTT
jgi:uncharacterized protein (TIRG00374 family)